MKTIDAIKPTLAKSNAIYLRGRAAQSALAPFATASEVLDALADAAPTPRPTRDAITLASKRLP